MASELIAGLGLFKTMFDVAKGLKNMNDAAVRNAAVIELQEHILTAQEQQSALVEEIRDLKTRMAELEAWDAEKQRYKLHDFGGETFAYILKEEESNGEPMHRICAPCYQKGHKSILQFRAQNAWRQDKYACPACKTDFLLGVRGDLDVD